VHSDPDDLYEEDIELDDFDPASLNAIFADRRPNRRPSKPALAGDTSDTMFDIEEEDESLGFELDEGPPPPAPARPAAESARPAPAFGSLADDDIELADAPGVFDVLEDEDAVDPSARPVARRTELPAVDPDIISRRQQAREQDERPAPPAQDREHTDPDTEREPQAAAASKPPKGLRAKLAAAKAYEQSRKEPGPVDIEGHSDQAATEPVSQTSQSDAADTTPSAPQEKGLKGLRAKIAAARASEQKADADAEDHQEDQLTESPAAEAATRESRKGRFTALKKKIADTAGSKEKQDSDESLAFPFDGEDEQPQLTGLAGIKAKIAAAKAFDRQHRKPVKKPSNPHFAGADVSPPKLKERIRNKIADAKASKNAPRAQELGISPRFEALLVPVTPEELSTLQRETQAEEPIFQRVERAKAKGARRQRWSLMLSILVFVLWLYNAGPSSLLTDVLPNAVIPDDWTWLSDNVNDRIITAGLFALGVTLPFFSIGVLAQGFAAFWRGMWDRRIDDILIALVAFCCAGGVLFSVEAGQPLIGAALMVIWLVLRTIATFIAERGVR
jgi:hypothetical protein